MILFIFLGVLLKKSLSEFLFKGVLGVLGGGGIREVRSLLKRIESAP